MSSSWQAIVNPASFDLPFWLPRGGTDNGVFATNWAELADLACNDVAPVLALLADADVGGYVASPGGQRRHRAYSPLHRLWVDSLQYHRAEDILMAYLNDRSRADRKRSTATS